MPTEDEPGPPAPQGEQEGWTVPKPEHIPAPTYQPAVMALGIAFVLFGLLTSFAFSVVGLVLFAIALALWIGDLVNGN